MRAQKEKKKRTKNAIIKSASTNLFHLIYRRQCVSVGDCMATDHEKFIQRQKSRFFFHQTQLTTISKKEMRRKKTHNNRTKERKKKEKKLA